MSDRTAMLIETKPDYAKSVLQDLRGKAYVISADIVLGWTYNIVALASIESLEELKERQDETKKIDGISSITTLPSLTIKNGFK